MSTERGQPQVHPAVAGYEFGEVFVVGGFDEFVDQLGGQGVADAVAGFGGAGAQPDQQTAGSAIARLLLFTLKQRVSLLVGSGCLRSCWGSTVIRSSDRSAVPAGGQAAVLRLDRRAGWSRTAAADD